MPDRERLIPLIATIVLSAMSLLALRTSETLAFKESTPSEYSSLYPNSIAWADAEAHATHLSEPNTLD